MSVQLELASMLVGEAQLMYAANPLPKMAHVDLAITLEKLAAWPYTCAKKAWSEVMNYMYVTTLGLHY